MRIRNWLFRVRTDVRLRYWRCIATLCGDRAVERFRRQQKWGALFFLAITPLVSVLTFATTKFDGLWCRLLLTISIASTALGLSALLHFLSKGPDGET